MNRDITDGLSEFVVGGDATCPNCGSRNVKTIQVSLSFTYGEVPTTVELSAVVPQRTCRDCGFSFLDGDAEDAKHDAVCRHLGVMTPAEVRSLRESCGLNRTQFARLTRLGEATLGRWERGALVQNAAYDQFLYLLSFPENISRLRSREPEQTTPCAPVARSTPRFRALAGPQLANAEIARAKFRLISCDEAA